MIRTATSGTKAINSVSWAGLVSLAPKKKKGSTIQYSYRKWGTHARVFSQRLAHGNSKNEIRQTDEHCKRGVSMEKRTAARKKEVLTAYHYLIKMKY